MKTIKLLLLPTLLLISFLTEAQTLNSQLRIQEQIQDLIIEHAGDYTSDYLEWSSLNKETEAGLKTLTWLRDSTFYYGWENENWLFESRYKVLTTDDYGNTLTGIREQFDSGIYSNLYYFEWSFYDATTPKDYIISAWNSDTEEWTELYRYEYNESGNIDSAEFRVWNFSNNEVTFGGKTELTYDNNDFLIEEFSYQWDLVNDAWSLTDKYTYTADDNEHVETSLREMVDPVNNLLVKEDSVFYENAEDGNVLTAAYFEWDVVVEGWETDRFTTYQYNMENNLDSSLTVVWAELQNDWVFLSQIAYTHNNNNQLTNRFDERWDVNLNAWENQRLEERTYDTSWNNLSRTVWAWEEFNNDWRGLNDYSYAYDMYDNNTERVIRFWDSNTDFWMNRDSLRNFYSEVDVMVNTETPKQQSLEVSPNPSSGLFTLTYANTTEESSCQVLDVNGKEILNQPFLKSKLELDLSSFPKGIYFLVLSTGEVHKLIRQ